ncbi:MAG: PA14 domain-containing protein [Pirellulales bacterium]
MPDLFHGMSEQERRERGAALASFLATTGSIVDRPGDTAAIERGEQLYHSIGCIACHAPRRGDHNLAASSVPLGNLTAKYTVDSLSKFLINPHAVRPSGNMPRLVNGLTEARDLACYLLGNDIVGVGAEQFAATVYHGSWDKLPNFAELQPVKQAHTLGLDLSIAGRRDNFAIVFEAFLPIANAGQYTFHIASDDGSRLLIDGEEVVKVDGVHPRTERAGRKRLTAGMHKVRVEYFEGGGEEVLSLEVEGADFGRSPINMLITSDEKGEVKRELIPAVFKPDSSQAEKGRDLFTRSGCANCHALKTDGGLLTGEIKAPPLALVKADKGCLAGDVPRGAPQYELTWNQRSSIAAALKAIASPLKDDEQIHLQLAGKNCYACHSRGTLGGPEPVRDPMFLTKTQEMGNEGRVPPPLTGVGDKLKPEVIDSIIADGAKDRPYMLTRMPAFGRETTPGLREKLVAVDRREGAAHALPGQDSPDGKQLISSGRKLVGGEGLACIKCHVFGNKATPGIQAMDLLKMSSRLRDDWFRRYMLAPAEYRPGTRMPLSFPDGKSVLSSVLDGDAHKQIDAMWMYLAQGKDARPPAGIDAEAIILSADAKPVIYRNFIEGLTPRGIAVGYPERVNIAWDANRMALRLLWKNEFIDASKHWVGRGPGFQGPLGDFAVNIETDSPLARLAAEDAPWPAKTDREEGYKFLGYALDAGGRPTFRYRFGETEVEETPIPAVGNKGLSIVKRQFKVRSRSGSDKLVLRAAVGNIASQADGSFRVDDKVTVRCEGVTLQTVTVAGKTELRAVLPADGEIAFTQTIAW